MSQQVRSPHSMTTQSPRYEDNRYKYGDTAGSQWKV